MSYGVPQSFADTESQGGGGTTCMPERGRGIEVKKTESWGWVGLQKKCVVGGAAELRERGEDHTQNLVGSVEKLYLL